jgi:hypothetical protein
MEEKEHLAQLNYLKACNFLFENGILSHMPIYKLTSEILVNMDNRFQFFHQWMATLPDIIEHKNLRSPVKRNFLAWQTWDYLEVMYFGRIN